MSKKQLVGLAAYNSSEKINSANWTNKLAEPVSLNQGDTITVKASFIDTRNSISGNIVIDEDTTISLDYMFYYVNRGGTGIKSGIQTPDYRFDPLFPDRQITCLEFIETRTANQLPAVINPALTNTEDPNAQGNPFDNPGVSTSIPVVWTASGNSNPLPVTNDITATGMTTQNLSPLVESVYHCYSSSTINKANGSTLGFSPTAISTPDLVPGTIYKIATVGTTSAWDTISGNQLLMPVVNAGPIFKCVEAEPAPVPVPITNGLLSPGESYTVADTGFPWTWTYTDAGGNVISGNFDTNWSYYGITGDPTVGQIFTTPAVPPAGQSFLGAFSADPTNLPSFSAFYTSNGYDLSQIGGNPPTPVGDPTPLYDSTTDTWMTINPDSWYAIKAGLTVDYTDGTQIPYNMILGNLNTPNGYFLNNSSSFVTDGTIPDPSAYTFNDEPTFLKLSPGQEVRALNLGNYNWIAIGASFDQIEAGVPFNFTITSTPVPQFKTTLTQNPDGTFTEEVGDPDPITGIEFFVIPTEVLQAYAANPGVYITATKNNMTSDTINANLVIQTNPTGATYSTPDYGTAFPQEAFGTDHSLFNNTELFTNTIDYNAADGMPYVLTYCSPTNPDDGSQTYNPNGMNPGDCVPFIKRWSMVLKAGSYQPDYLAQIITRAMSTQKEKINVPSTTSAGLYDYKYLATPIAGIGSQLYDPTLNPLPVGQQANSSTTFNGSAINYYIQTTPADQYSSTGGTWPFRAPNLPQGPFMYTSGTPGVAPTGPYAPNVDVTTYQPSLFFNSKNPAIMPTGDVIPKKLPVNPKYNGQDFNNPTLGYKDDQAFIYRPNAYVTQTPRSVETNQYGLAFGTAIGDIKNAEIVPHLMYNDANLDNFNNMPSFGKTFDNNLKAIPMMYRPFISDTSSSYFNKIQFTNNVPVGNDYGIIPIISNSIFGQSGVSEIQDDSQTTRGYLSSYTYNGSLEVSTPLVGAPEMNLSFNVENTNLFSFENLHTSIFVKPDAQATGVQASTALIPTTFNDFQEIPIVPTENTNSFYFTIPVLTTPVDGYSFFAPTLVPINIVAAWIDGSTDADYQYALNPDINLAQPVFANNPGWTGNPTYQSFIQINGSLLGGKTPDNDCTILFVVEADGTAQFTVFQGVPAKFTNKTVKSLPAVQQLNAQSGIIFSDMSAVTKSGVKTPFWESLGFDVASLCKKYNPANPSDPFMTLEEFYTSTTRDFSGASNNFDPTIITAGSNEQSYISYTDSLKLLGWYTPPTFNLGLPAVSANPTPPDYTDAEMGAGQGITSFTLQNKIIYNTVDSSINLAGNIPYVDLTDGGHYLISIDGYKGSLITDNGVMNCKTIISTYYQAANSFVINSEPDSAIYEHIGEPLLLSSIKVRIIDPVSGKEVANLGGNSSVYLEITRSLSKNTIATGQLTNTE